MECAKPPFIIALDIASRTGVAEGCPGTKPLLSTVNFKTDATDNHSDIFGRALRWMNARLDKADVDLVVIEGQFTLNDSALPLGLRGVILGACNNRVRVREVAVNTWRKYFIGAGNLKGDAAKRQCVLLCDQLKWTLPRSSRGTADHNAAEAAGIWLWSCAVEAPQLVQRAEPLFARVVAEIDVPLVPQHRPHFPAPARRISRW